MTDSAGVEIVESIVPRWAEGGGWTVDPDPVLDLAETGSGSEHEFFRVTDAVRFAGERIAVANSGTMEIRVFGSDGSFLASAGGEGGGPGEFQRMRNVRRYRGDSLLVYDFWTRRLNVFDRSMQLARIVTVGLPDVRVPDVLPMGDGTLLARVDKLEYPEGTTGLYRGFNELRRMSGSGELLDTVMLLAGPESFVGAQFDARPILGKRGHTLVVDDRIYHGTAERMEYEVWSAGGDLETIVRVSGYDLTLSAEEILLEREARLPANAPARFRQLQASLPDPESRPAYSKLLVSTDGHVWLAEDHGFAGRYDPTDWEVFAPDGVWLGSVRTPERFTAFRFNDDIVLGVWLDELDVEHVQLLELVRH